MTAREVPKYMYLGNLNVYHLYHLYTYVLSLMTDIATVTLVKLCRVYGYCMYIYFSLLSTILYLCILDIVL